MSDDFDRFLHDYRAEPDPEFAANLHARLSRLDAQPDQATQGGLLTRLLQRAGARLENPNQKGQPMKQRSPWKARLAAAMMVITLFVAVPPLRALATDILQQLGVLKITNAPTYPEEVLANPDYGDNDLKSTVSLDGVGPIPSAAEISAEAGFPVYEPQQLPERARLFDRGVAVRHEDTLVRKATITMYMLNAHGAHLALHQQELATTPPGELPVGSATTQMVMVGANEGVWIEHTAMSMINTQKLGYNNVLMWNADGYMFSLTGDTDVTLETMKSFAESLAPGQ